MAINLKKLQSIARRRLELKGSVEFNPVPKGQISAHGLGREYLGTRTNTTTMAHTISYSDSSSLEPSDVFHEMCKAKLNEMGFTTIEAAALGVMSDCSKDDPKYIVDANSASAIVIETYANSILFSLFPEESKEPRERMALRFESSDALTTLHTQMGFWGTGGVCYHLAASKNSETFFPQDLIEKAIGRASDGEAIRKEYDTINSLLDELPKVDLKAGVERFSDTDGIKIVEVMVRLFAAKTGLDCELG
ncbi:MAG: hypothetical protein JRN52_09090 [Nitrososphaerota archaeon]|nr:hypothetical protein [Nitrososphaerota archaeon]